MPEQPPVFNAQAQRNHNPMRRTWIRAGILAGVGLIVLPLVCAASELLPVMPPIRGLVMVQSMAWLFAYALIAYVVAPIAIVALMVKQRRWRLPGVMVLLGLALGLVGWIQSGTHALRVKYLMGVPQRAAPMIRALEAYKADEGRYPDRLDAIVPRYLGRVPGTGMGGYSELYYSENKHGFRLSVPIPFGMKFDFLKYKSSRQYSDYGPPRPIEELLGSHPAPREPNASPHRVYLMPGGWAYYPE